MSMQKNYAIERNRQINLINKSKKLGFYKYKETKISMPKQFDRKK